MSVISPKTIVITAYPGKHGSITMQQTTDFNVNVLNRPTVDAFDIDSGGSKKRRRLTHLSPDEKLLRRKLKNRVAAQTARDRKKALMTELEEKVAQLEEENKLLRKQNGVLRTTSETLVHENQELKSRLSETTVPEVKTESDTSRFVRSTCYSSAEGTSTDFVSTNGSLLHLCRDSKPDFLGILEDLTDSSQCSRSQKKTATSIAQSVNQPERHCVPSSTRTVVGLSSAELESLNELIHIDHVYFKPQPETPEAKEIPASTVAHESSKDFIRASPKMAVTSSSGMKRDHLGKVVFPNVSSSEKTVPILPEFNRDATASLSTTNTADELINSLSDSEIGQSIDFLQNLEFENFLNEDANTATPCIQIRTPASLAAPSLQSEFISSMKPSVNSRSEELDTDKLFDEIYDSYINAQNTASPDAANLSDSGVGSDIGEALSPESTEVSLLDDYPWQDSFTDLFPDLQ